MSSSLRKVKRAQEVAKRKLADKAMRHMQRAMNNMPKACSTCAAEFDPKVPGALESWHVSLSQDATLMTCPDCWTKQSAQ